MCPLYHRSLTWTVLAMWFGRESENYAVSVPSGGALEKSAEAERDQWGYASTYLVLQAIM